LCIEEPIYFFKDFFSKKFIPNRKKLEREIQIRIMLPVGMKIERTPDKDDVVKNPVKKNSSGLIIQYCSLRRKFWR